MKVRHFIFFLFHKLQRTDEDNEQEKTHKTEFATESYQSSSSKDI